MAENRGTPVEAEPFNGIGSKRNPVRRRKVDSFSAVEAFIEATMIRLWKRDNKLAAFLLEAINRDTCDPSNEIRLDKYAALVGYQQRFDEAISRFVLKHHYSRPEVTKFATCCLKD